MKRILLLVILIYSVSTYSISQDISFQAQTVDDNFAGPAGIFISDLNNDNRSDILCAGADENTIAWWRNTGSQPPTWSKQIIDSDFGSAIYVSAGDLDGDGLTDVLGAAWDDHELAWWKNGGGDSIIWTKYIIKESFTSAHEIMPLDIDDDGDLDVLGVSAGLNRISWFENDGNSPVSWIEHTIVPNFGGARSVDAKDIDGDGDIDLAGAALEDDEIAWWRNDGGTPIQWTKFTINSTFTFAHKVHIVDMNNDGREDILGTAYNSGLSWWQNNGNDTTMWTKHDVSSYNTAVIGWAIDVDNDNDKDLVCSAQQAGKLKMWKNEDGLALTWTNDLIDNFAGAWPLHYGDLDNDGDIDLVCGGNSANEIRWYENDLISNETVMDYDGNVYNIISIGYQQWLKENLKSLHYSNGDEITEVWAYDDDETNVETYGRLYTWDGAMKYSTIPGSQGACPNGWHVPTDEEWSDLGTLLGGDNIAGGKMKEAGTQYWLSPNTGATNESGFTALPAGEYDDTHYQLLNEYAVIWSSTETSSSWCKYRYLSYNDAELHTYDYYKNFRYSVRCIKDNTVSIEQQGYMDNKYIIHPNPASETISIHLSNHNNYPVDIHLYDISGRILKTALIKSEKDKVAIPFLPAGLYFIGATINDEYITTKFLKK